MPRKPVKRTARTALPAGYVRFLTGLKDQIRKAQVKAALSVNGELVKLYWHVGSEILIARSVRGGAAKWWSVWVPTCSPSSRRWVACRQGTCSICGPSPRHFPIPQLCSRLLHNCPGRTTWSSSISSSGRRNASGMRPRPFGMDGAVQCWPPRSRPKRTSTWQGHYQLQAHVASGPL